MRRDLLAWEAAQAPLFDVPTRSAAQFGRREALALFCRHGLLILGCVIFVSLVALAGALCQQRLYTSSAQLLIRMDQGAPSVLSGVAAYRESTGQELPGRRIETEMSQVRNRTSIEAVIREYDLTAGDLRMAPLDAVLAPIKMVWKALTQRAGAVGVPPSDAELMNEKVEAFNKSLGVEVLRSKAADTTSNLIDVHLTGTDKYTVQGALDMLLNMYQGRDRAREDALVHEAVGLLQAQTQGALDELNRFEQAYVAYSTGPAAEALAGQQLRNPGEAAPGGVSPPTAKLRGDLQELQTRLETLRETYTDQFEGVRSLRAAIAQLRTRMLDETREMVRTSVEVGVLERRRAQAQARYVELQRKLDQVELYLKLSPASIDRRVSIEAPRAAVRESRLGVHLTVLAGPLVGLAFGLLLASVLSLLDRRLQTPAAVRAALDLDVLGAVPIESRSSPRGGGLLSRLRRRRRPGLVWPPPEVAGPGTLTRAEEGLRTIVAPTSVAPTAATATSAFATSMSPTAAPTTSTAAASTASASTAPTSADRSTDGADRKTEVPATVAGKPRRKAQHRADRPAGDEGTDMVLSS